jgi:C4-dicarboxylate-specific signal transduction histidine kinase
VHLQQVILNLVINAIEAIGSASDGPRELVIRCSEVDSCVLVTVRDSWPALAPDALERAFDAFYTIKQAV